MDKLQALYNLYLGKWHNNRKKLHLINFHQQVMRFKNSLYNLGKEKGIISDY